MRVAKGAALAAASMASCIDDCGSVGSACWELEPGSVGFACSLFEPVGSPDMVRSWDFLRDSTDSLLLCGVEWFWGSSRVKLGLDTELLSLFIAARREEVRAWHGILESKDSRRDSYWGGIVLSKSGFGSQITFLPASGEKMMRLAMSVGSL